MARVATPKAPTGKASAALDAAALDAAARVSPKGSWHSLAKKLYKSENSFQSVSEALRAQGFEVSKSTVRNYLDAQDDVLIHSPVAKHEVWKSIPVAGAETLAARKAMVSAMKGEGASEDKVRMYLEREEARYQPVVFHTYNDDPIFNEPKFLDIAADCVRDWHYSTRNQIEGEGFEYFLARALSEAGYEVELARRGNPGEDIRVKVQNQWVAISQKSENRSDAKKDVISITSLAPHRETLDDPASCVKAVKAAVQHLKGYERMIYLKTGEVYFPEADIGELGVAAQGYTMLEVPKEKLQKILAGLKEEDFHEQFTKNSDGSWKRKKANTVHISITGDEDRTLFSLTLAKKEGRVRIYNIGTGWCDLVNRMWAPALDGSREDKE